MKKLLCLLSVIFALQAFGSEPDFAYPKSVMKSSEKELKQALKQDDGPATLQALICYGLASTAINPDDTNRVKQLMEKTTAKVKQPATKAMIELLMANMLRSDSLTLATMDRYEEPLSDALASDWRKVIAGESHLLPTLFDFAAVQALSPANTDSIANLMLARNAHNYLGRYFWNSMKSRHDDFAAQLSIYNKENSCSESIYYLENLAVAAQSPDERRQAYKIALEWGQTYPGSAYSSNLSRILDYLTRPSLSISGSRFAGRNRPYQLNIKAVCVNDASLSFSRSKGNGSSPKAEKLHFSGSGVFEVDTVIELQFGSYGVFDIKPAFPGYTGKNHIEVTVTDIMVQGFCLAGRNEYKILNATDGSTAEGATLIEEKNRYGAARGDDRFTPVIYPGGSYSRDTTATVYANLITDRSIYHPGDSLRVVTGVVRFNGSSGTNAVVSGRRTSISLYNANGQLIDSVSGITDAYGRLSASFCLPKDGLTGYFGLKSEDSWCNVVVTDYQAPTFEVTLKSERLTDGEVRVYGLAEGYNGFPIGDAQVKISVSELPAWVWWHDFSHSGGRTLASAEVTTLADGTFESRFSVPDSLSLNATAIVSYGNGETHEASSFIPAKPYFISADVPQYYVPDGPLPVSVSDVEGSNVYIPYILRLTNVFTGESLTPDSLWSNVPSGEYTLRISPEEPAFANPWTSGEFFVYRPSDSMPPTECSLFVPQQRINCGDSILYGTSYTDAHIWLTLWSPSGIIRQELLTPGAGMHRLAVRLPDNVSEATLTLSMLHNFKFETRNIAVERPGKVTGLKVKISTMRNRMAPGDTERWSIAVTDNLGRPAKAALILDVYAKALDALMPYSPAIHARSNYSPGLTLNYSNDYQLSTSIQGKSQFKRTLSADLPHFNLYGQSWGGYRVYDRSLRLYSMSMNMKMAAADTSEDEVAVAEVTADSGGTASDAPAEEFRLPEIPVALWAPLLVTDAAGQTAIEFVAPNAVTTWNIVCLAYGKTLLNGSVRSEVLVSKPVMVAPRLPRFMRVGDEVLLRAMAQNATDSALRVATLIEVFDPLGNRILSQQRDTLQLAAQSAAPVELRFIAPDVAMVGVRCRVDNGEFSDGEQSVIAILPSDVSLRSGISYFLPTDSVSAEIDVPKGSVLTFTANAVWECVEALPGLQATQGTSAFSALSSLFSASIGRGLLRKYPIIASALSRWEASDSVLISKLMANEDLKFAMLESTPWVSAARSDAEAHAQLILLLNSRQAQQVIDRSIRQLEQLVRGSGLTWTADGDSPSLWVTMNVLRSLGQLKQLGFLPVSKALDKLIRNAVSYLDSEVGLAYSKNRKHFCNPDYAEVRLQFPEVAQSTWGKRAVASTVQELAGHWRELGFEHKARAAIILYKSGYEQTARAIIESLRQFEAWRQTGLSATLLNAFALVEPQAPEVDEIRQFYISRKQSMDWGSGMATSSLIASILGSGAQWLVPAANELHISVEGQLVSPNVEEMMGAFRLDLPDGGRVNISKGRFPGWGGVITHSTDSIAAIPAQGSDALSVSRRVSGSLAVGSKISITVEITVSQPLDYVVVRSPRAAGLEPVNQLPGRCWLSGCSAYREPCLSETNWFIERLPKGKTILTEEYFISAEGAVQLAPVEVQSLYAPEFSAHSDGSLLNF